MTLWQILRRAVRPPFDRALVSKLQQAGTKRERLLAIDQLAETLHPGAIPHLEREFQRPQGGVRVAAVRGIARIGGKRAREFLGGIIWRQEDSAGVFEAAKEELARMFPDNSDYVPDLVARARCARALAENDPGRRSSGLVQALNDGDQRAARLMLEQGLDPNCATDGGLGWTPLHYAAGNRWPLEAVELLIRHGADPRLQDDAGDTAMHRAAESECRELMEIFAGYSETGTLKNRRGQTAQDIVDEIRRQKKAQKRSPWMTCPACKGHGGYGGMSKPFVRCSRCGGSGEVVKPGRRADPPQTS